MDETRKPLKAEDRTTDKGGVAVATGAGGTKTSVTERDVSAAVAASTGRSTLTRLLTRFRINRNRLNFIFGLMAYIVWLVTFLYARRHNTTFEIPAVVSLAGGLGAVTCISMGSLIALRQLRRRKAGTSSYVILALTVLAIIYYVAGLFVKPVFGR